MKLMVEAGAPITFSAVSARLSESGQTLLHSTITADYIGDEQADDAASVAVAQACLRAIEAGAVKRRIDQLRAMAKSAEREGQMDQALKWLKELTRLEKENKQRGGESAAGGVVH
jgi:hypothetical protein